MDPSWTEESGIDLVRKAVFAAVMVREGNRTQKVSTLLAYTKQLGMEAAQRKKGASSERLWFLKRLDRKGKLQVKGEIVISPVLLAKVEYKEWTDELSKICGVIYLCMLPEIEAKFAAAKGELVDGEAPKPFWLELDLAMDWLRRFRKRMQRAKAGKPYPVGYCKTPVSTRWPKGRSGNPAGRKSQEIWDQLVDSLMAPLSVTRSDGRKSTLTRIEVEIAQIFSAAMMGERQARRSVRELVKLLDDKGLLSPPPAPPKQKRTPRKKQELDPRLAACTKLKFWLIARCIYRDLMDLYSNRYGRIADFTTTIELSLAPSQAEIEIADLASLGSDFGELSRISAPRWSDPAPDVEEDLDGQDRPKSRRCSPKASRRSSRKGAAGLERTSQA